MDGRLSCEGSSENDSLSSTLNNEAPFMSFISCHATTRSTHTAHLRSYHLSLHTTAHHFVLIIGKSMALFGTQLDTL
jgi:hypothetical protein